MRYDAAVAATKNPFKPFASRMTVHLVTSDKLFVRVDTEIVIVLSE